MKKTLLIVVALFTLTTSYKAQKWTELMQNPNANFYDIVKEFDEYWKDKPYEKGQGYKAFKRWQWFMEPRVYPTGDLKFAARGYALEKYNEFLQENLQFKSMASAAVSATTANWTPLGPFGSPSGGDAGRLQCIALKPGDPNTIYVGAAAGGFWMSNNGGVSYTTTTDQIGSLGVSGIAVNPLNTNIIYISTGDKDAGDTYATGVLKSTNGGLTWNTTGLVWTVSQQRRIYRLLINPVNPNTLIAATTNGMYRSLNAGTSWSLVASGSFVDAEYRPGDTTIVYAVAGSNIAKSTNGGASFSNVSVGAPSVNRMSIAVTPANNNYVYVLVSNTSNGFGGLYRSTNSGSSYGLMSNTPNIFDWNATPSGTGGQGWYDIAIDASPTNANEITCGGVNTWKSTNGGSTWVLNTHWYGGGGKPYVHADLHCVLYASGTTCYLGTDGGIARTTNSGTNWTTINGAMNIAQIYKLGLSASNAGRIVTGHQDNGTNLSNGTSWSQIYGGDGCDCFIDWGNNNTIVASYVYGDFQRSTNGGGSWTNIISGLTGTGAWVAPIVQHPTQQNTYYCGYKHVFKSTNQGTTWTQLGTINQTLDEIKIAPSNTNIIFATSASGVWKTINGGTTWSNVTGTIPTGSGQITDLAIDNQNPNNIYVTLSGYSSGNKVFYSSNGGSTWTNYSTGLPNIPTNCIVYTNNSSQALYIGTDVGVYYREASMTSWVPYFTGLPNIIVNDMEIYYPTGKLRAATYARGVWETSLYSNPAASPAAAFSTAFSPGCVSTALQFNDLSSNAPTSWSWSFPGASPAISSAQNPNVTYTSTGTYSVTLISTNGNGTSTPYTTTVSIVGTPTVLAVPASVCIGQIGSIGVNSNATVINWQTGQVGAFISVSNTVNSIYSFTASLGACNTVGTSTLFVNPTPNTPTVIVGSGVLSTTVIASTYQWYLNGSAIAGETSSTITPTQDGFYSVWVANGSCQASSQPLQIILTSLKENSVLNSAVLWPNPVKDQLTVSFNDVLTNDVYYEIENSLGQLVVKSKFKITNKETIINTQGLAQGVYYLKLKNENKQTTYIFIKN
jgi:PKD repeat protein